jgi:hypothetical protein
MAQNKRSLTTGRKFIKTGQDQWLKETREEGQIKGDGRLPTWSPLYVDVGVRVAKIDFPYACDQITFEEARVFMDKLGGFKPRALTKTSLRITDWLDVLLEAEIVLRTLALGGNTTVPERLRFLTTHKLKLWYPQSMRDQERRKYQNAFKPGTATVEDNASRTYLAYGQRRLWKERSAEQTVFDVGTRTENMAMEKSVRLTVVEEISNRLVIYSVRGASSKKEKTGLQDKRHFDEFSNEAQVAELFGDERVGDELEPRGEVPNTPVRNEPEQKGEILSTPKRRNRMSKIAKERVAKKIVKTDAEKEPVGQQVCEGVEGELTEQSVDSTPIPSTPVAPPAVDESSEPALVSSEEEQELPELYQPLPPIYSQVESYDSPVPISLDDQSDSSDPELESQQNASNWYDYFTNLGTKFKEWLPRVTWPSRAYVTLFGREGGMSVEGTKYALGQLMRGSSVTNVFSTLLQSFGEAPEVAEDAVVALRWRSARISGRFYLVQKILDFVQSHTLTGVATLVLSGLALLVLLGLGARSFNSVRLAQTFLYATVIAPIGEELVKLLLYKYLRIPKILVALLFGYGDVYNCPTPQTLALQTIGHYQLTTVSEGNIGTGVLLHGVANLVAGSYYHNWTGDVIKHTLVRYLEEPTNLPGDLYQLMLKTKFRGQFIFEESLYFVLAALVASVLGYKMRMTPGDALNSAVTSAEKLVGFSYSNFCARYEPKETNPNTDIDFTLSHHAGRRWQSYCTRNDAALHTYHNTGVRTADVVTSPAPCLCNVITMATSRMGGVGKRFIGKEEPDLYLDELERCKEFYRHLTEIWSSRMNRGWNECAALFVCKDLILLTLDDWLLRYPENMRKCMYARFTKKRHKPTLAFDMMVKIEKNILPRRADGSTPEGPFNGKYWVGADYDPDGCGGGCPNAFAPRGISVPPYEVRCIGGPASDYMNRWLCRKLNGQVKYACGMTGQKLGQWRDWAMGWVVQNRTWALIIMSDDAYWLDARGDELTCYGADFSRLDMHMHEAAIESINQQLEVLGFTEVADLARRMMLRKYIYRAKDRRILLKMSTMATMPSGYFYTSCGNTWVTSMMFSYALTNDWNPRDFAYECGFHLKIDQSNPVTNPLKGKFLQKRFYLTTSGERWAGPLIGRTFAKAFWHLGPIKNLGVAMKHVKAVVLSLYNDCHHIPLMNDLFDRLLEICSDVDCTDIVQNQYEKDFRPRSTDCASEHPDTELELCDLYHIDLNRLRAWRCKLRQWRWGELIEDQFEEEWDQIRKVDLQ